MMSALFVIGLPCRVFADEPVILPPALPALDAALTADLLAQQAAAAAALQADPALPAVVTPEPVAAPGPVLPTYVDVCIDTQTMVYYENGVPLLISPVVTGSPGRGTPRGVFQINSCVPGKYLTGPTWHVWVNRWMRFSGNCGLHDASWRKQFGGDIYKRNGSHGCVNLPHDIAVALYDRVGIGTVVIVH